MSDVKKLHNYKIITDIPLSTYAENDITITAQLKLSKSIKDVMINSKVQSVALYGQWGSGKSTVVKMIAKELAIKDEEIIFDFWNHAGDKLRRTFLETLLCKIDANNLTMQWDDECTKDSEKQKVSVLSLIKGSYQKIDTVETPATLEESQKWGTSLMLGFIITFVVLPNFFSAGDVQKFIYKLTYKFLYFDVFVLKLLGLGISSLVSKCIAFKWCPKIGELVSRKLNVNSVNKITKSTTEQNDLSENDFKKLYHEILKKIIENKQYVLLCLDNLDRISSEQCRTVIDDLYLFIQEAKVCEYLKIIVPIDDSALDNVLSPNKKDDEDASAIKSPSNSNFMHKLFPIKFRLPDMINLEWRDLMSNTLTKAGFKEKQDQIITIFDKCRRSGGATTITPRDIIYYINTLITISYEADGLTGIELEDIARYVGLTQFHSRNDIFETFKKAYTPKENSEDASGIEKFFEHLTEKERVKLFKIHYQTDTPYETLYHDDIVSWVTNGDTASIDKLKECLKMPSSIDVFTTVINDSGTKWEELDNQIKLYEVVSKVFTEEEQKIVVNKLTDVWEEYLYGTLFNKWTATFTDEPIYKILLWLAQHDNGNLTYSLTHFWKWEILSQNDKKELVLRNPNVLDNARKAYWQFLQTIDNKTFKVDFYTNTIRHSITFDELSDGILKIIAKYYPTDLTAILPPIVTVEPLDTSYAKIDLVYLACRYIDNHSDKETSYTNASKLIKDICAKIDTTTSTQFIYLAKIIIESLFYLKDNASSLYNEAIESFKTVTRKPAMLSQFLTSVDYKKEFIKFCIVMVDTDVEDQNAINVNLVNYLPHAYSLLEKEYSQYANEFMNSILNFIVNNPHNYNIALTYFKANYATCKNIWDNLIKQNSAKYSPELPDEAFIDEAIRSVFINTMGKEEYLAKITPLWEDGSIKTLANEAETTMFWPVLNEQLKNSPLEDNGLITILKANYDKIDETTSKAIIDKAIKSVGDDGFVEYFNLHRGILELESPQTKLRNKFIGLLKNKTLPTNIIKVLENAKYLELNIENKQGEPRKTFVTRCNKDEITGQEALAKLNELFPSTKDKKPTKKK